MANVADWALTAGGNNTGSPPDFPIEGMAPSAVNDTMRENMAAVARWYNDIGGALVSGGSGNAYTLTTNTGHSSLVDQPVLMFRANRANTGAATLNVDGLGAKSLRFRGATLASGALAANVMITATYNASTDQYDLQSSIAITPAMVPDLAASRVTSGTFDDARIPNLNASKTTAGIFSLDRIPTLTADKIPNLDAGRITTGVFADARIPSLAASKTTSGTFADARIPNLAASKVTSGAFADARIPTNIVRDTRQVTAGNGLTGGGTLAANRSLAMSGSYTGTFTATGDVRAGSDRRLKTDIIKLDNAMGALRQITGYRYWRDDIKSHQVGVIAQEVLEVLPDAIGVDDEGMLSVAHNQIIALLVEAVKELEGRLNGLAD